MADIHLYTAATMNGWKPLIFLHEAEIDYELTYVRFDQKQQKSPSQSVMRKRLTDWHVHALAGLSEGRVENESPLKRKEAL